MKKIVNFVRVLLGWFTPKRSATAKADLTEVLIRLGLVEKLAMMDGASREQCVQAEFYATMHDIRRVWLGKAGALATLRNDEELWGDVLPYIKEIDLLFLFSVLHKYHEEFGTDDSRVGRVPSDETLVSFFHKRQDLLRKIVQFYQHPDASPRYKAEVETWVKRIAAFYVSLTLQAPGMILRPNLQNTLQELLEAALPVVNGLGAAFWEQLGYWWTVAGQPSAAESKVRHLQFLFLYDLLGYPPALGVSKRGGLWEAETFDYPWDGSYSNVVRGLAELRPVSDWTTSMWTFTYPDTIGRLYDQFKQRPNDIPEPGELLGGVLGIISQQPLESAVWMMGELPGIGHYFGDNFDHHIPYNLEKLFRVMALEPAACKAIPEWGTFVGAVRAIATLSWEYAKETGRYAWMATTLTALPDEMLPEEAAQIRKE